MPLANHPQTGGKKPQMEIAEKFTIYRVTLSQLSQNVEKRNLLVPVGPERPALPFDMSSAVTVINQSREHL